MLVPPPFTITIMIIFLTLSAITITMTSTAATMITMSASLAVQILLIRIYKGSLCQRRLHFDHVSQSILPIAVVTGIIELLMTQGP